MLLCVLNASVGDDGSYGVSAATEMTEIKNGQEVRVIVRSRCEKLGGGKNSGYSPTEPPKEKDGGQGYEG